MNVEVRLVLATDVERIFDSLVAVYRDVFGPSQSNAVVDIKGFSEGLLDRHRHRKGFRLLIAKTPGANGVVGFAYGYKGEPGQFWHDTIFQALSPDQRQAWMHDYFEYVELAVSTSHQGRGFGGLLHDAILAGLPYQTAMLSTEKANDRALRLYLKRGWVPVLEPVVFSGRRRPSVVLGLDLVAFQSSNYARSLSARLVDGATTPS